MSETWLFKFPRKAEFTAANPFRPLGLWDRTPIVGLLKHLESESKVYDCFLLLWTVHALKLGTA